MEKSLSDREFKIVEHLVYLGTKKETAPVLAITERTMETHTKNIFRKLGITKLNELVLWYCGVAFHITEQIEAKKKEIASGTVACLLVVSMLLEPSEFLRYRRYRRKVEIEYSISCAPIGAA